MEYVTEIEKLSKSYGGKKAVDSFSLKMQKGRIYGLIGPNGAGKTTIMKMMAGLTGADSGSIKFFGSDDLDRMRERISFIIEEPYMDYGMTARQNMEYIRLLMVNVMKGIGLTIIRMDRVHIILPIKINMLVFGI